MISKRRIKLILKLSADLVFIPLSIYLALVIRLETLDVVSYFQWLPVVLTTVMSLTLFSIMKVYPVVIRYMGHHAFVTILISITLSAFILVFVNMLTYTHMPRSIPFIYWALLLFFMGGSRLFVLSYYKLRKSSTKERVVIYGAGESGRILLQSLSDSRYYNPVAFIDDKKELQGQVVHGLRVYHSDKLPALIERKGIDQVFLAMPSTDLAEKRQVIQFLEHLPIYVKTIPSLNDILSGRSQVDDIKELEIEDLLGRDAIAPDNELLEKCIKDKVVLVTGAGGSIGSELCRQIFNHHPNTLVLYELSEFALYQIGQELCKLNHNNVKLVTLLGSVQDEQRLSQVFSCYKVNTVYHAAAYKHVPLVEENIIEGVRNNIFGTCKAAKAAITAGVETFMLISTDKAVRPTNIMGASKRFAEMVLQSLTEKMSGKISTRFCMVRFGNVLGSSGSVVPLFKKQIKHGGPLTVTHPEIIRYFMTIPEAVQLVLQASSMGQGGDVFVLDMGEPVKIVDLAKKMIHLSGFEVKDEANAEGDIEISFTGLRPGEKLYEELLIGDNVSGTRHPEIMRAEEHYLLYDELETVLEQLHQACDDYNIEAVKALFLDSSNKVAYAPTSQIINDLLWCEMDETKGNPPPHLIQKQG